MDMIGPVRWYTDLYGVTEKDMESLLCSNVWETEYKAFFVAVGQFDKAGKSILNICDYILMPVWETADGKRIAEEFRRQLKESGETKIYSGILEFPFEDAGSMEAAVAIAVKKVGEVMNESCRGDSQVHVRTGGFVGGFDG